MAGAALTHTVTELVHEDRLATLLAGWDKLDFSEPERAWMGTADTRAKLAQFLERAHRQSGGVSGVRVKYSRSKVGERFGGRLFAEGPSLQSLLRKLRHTLARDLYHDLDMVNAHPALLLQMDGVGDLPHLRSYTAARDERLRELQTLNAAADMAVSRDSAKQTVLAVINGGTSDAAALAVVPAWLDELTAEMRALHARVAEHPDNKRLRSWVERTHGRANVGGSMLNHKLCAAEDQCIQAALAFLRSRSLPCDNVVLVFDGLMLPCGLACVDAAFLEAMSAHVKTATSYAVEFTEKAMDEALDLSALEPVRRAPTPVVLNDREAADLIAATLGDRVRFVDGKRAFARTRRGVWSDCPREVAGVLKRIVTESGIKRLDAQGKPQEYASNDVHARAIVSLLASDPATDPDFPRLLRLSNMRKVFFEDGVYDFDIGEHGMFRAETAEDLPVFRIPRPYPAEGNAELEAEVRRRVLDDAFGDAAKVDNVAEHLARALANECEDKQMVIVEGERDSGKGNMASLVETAFGPYVATINSNVFLFCAGCGEDAAKKLSWMLACEHKRIVFTQEIKVDPSNPRHRVDGATLKMAVSGGDNIQARGNYMDEVNTNFDARVFFFCNQFPPVEPRDALDFIQVVRMPYKFVSQERFDAEHDRLSVLRVGDSGIKRWCRRPDVVDAFVRIVLQAYRRRSERGVPPCELVLRDSTQWRRDNAGGGGDDACEGTDELAQFAAVFEFTGARDDFVFSRQAAEALREAGAESDSKKIRARMENMGATYDHNLPVPGGGGARRRGWRGVRVRDEAGDALAREAVVAGEGSLNAVSAPASCDGSVCRLFQSMGVS